MKIENYMEIIIKDFLPPIRALLPSFHFSVAIVLSVAVIVRLSNKKAFRASTCDKSRLTAWMIFLSYILVIFQTVFLSREPGSREAVSLVPFETWGHTMYAHAYFIENIIMFIPFGILLPILFKRMRRVRNCVRFGFLNSCIIEMAQFVTRRGYLQLDDVITNTVGALIGWLIWRGAGKIIKGSLMGADPIKKI